MLLGLALVAAGCGSGDDQTAEPAAPVADDSTSAATDSTAASATDSEPTAEADQGNDTDDEPEYAYPLDELLGIQLDGGEDTEARVQDAIVTCMAEQGFEYSPSGTSIMGMLGTGGEDDGPRPGSEAWVARYGFGISTQAFSQDDVGPNLIGSTGGDLSFGVDDANRAYVEGLTPADQAAYYQALYGVTAENLGAGLALGGDGLNEADGMAALAGLAGAFGAGCEAQANQIATGGFDMLSFFFQFGADFEAINDAITNDPRVIELQRTVTECVRSQGAEFNNYQEAMASFRTRLAPIQEAATVTGAELPTVDDLANRSMLELQDLLNQALTTTSNLTDAQKADLAVIQTDEVRVATAFDECGSGITGLSRHPIYNEVRVEVEQRFVDENFDRLVAFRDGQ
jgi:hypothetical protein